MGGRFQIHGRDIRAQERQQSRLHKRRLAAAGGSINQAHRERLLGIPFQDARPPEPNALGQSVTVAGARQQLKEEIGVMFIKRPEALGNDP